jgi:hypothetical protein
MLTERRSIEIFFAQTVQSIGHTVTNYKRVQRCSAEFIGRMDDGFFRGELVDDVVIVELDVTICGHLSQTIQSNFTLGWTKVVFKIA